MIINLNNVGCEILTGGKDNLHGNMIQEVRNYLSVKKPGSFFAKKYNKHASDRKFFCTPKGKFPSGFLPYVHIHLKNEFPGLDLTVVDERTNLIQFDEELDYNVHHWDMRDYQKEALHACNNWHEQMYWPRGIIDAATNAGKNSIIAGIHQNLGNHKTLMLIHNQDIKKQALEWFGEMYDVGQIHGNKFETEPSFVIAMAQTLFNRAKSSVNVRRWLSTIDTLIVDESHKAGAKNYSRLLSWINAGQRFLVSGTPLDMADPIKKMLMIGLCGVPLYKISNKQLIDKGVSNECEVHIYLNDTGQYTYDSYTETYEEIIKFSIPRVEKMKDYIISNPERQILISVDNIDHGEFLYNHLYKFCHIKQLYGTSSDRDEIINDFKNYDIRVIITTLLQEGINAGIDTLIYAQGGKAKIPVKQYTGRILRKKGKFDVSHVVDFFDRAKYVDVHSRARFRIYKGEEFPITYHYNNNRFGTYIE